MLAMIPTEQKTGKGRKKAKNKGNYLKFDSNKINHLQTFYKLF